MFPGPSKTSYNSSSAFRFSDKGTKETEDRAQKWNMWSSTIQVYVQRTRRTIQGNKQSCLFSIFLGPGKTCWGRGVIRNLSWNWVPEEMAAATNNLRNTCQREKYCEWGKRFCNSFGEHCIFCWFLIAKTRTEHIDKRIFAWYISSKSMYCKRRMVSFTLILSYCRGSYRKHTWWQVKRVLRLPGKIFDHRIIYDYMIMKYD